MPAPSPYLHPYMHDISQLSMPDWDASSLGNQASPMQDPFNSFRYASGLHSLIYLCGLGRKSPMHPRSTQVTAFGPCYTIGLIWRSSFSKCLRLQFCRLSLSVQTSLDMLRPPSCTDVPSSIYLTISHLQETRSSVPKITGAIEPPSVANHHRSRRSTRDVTIR